MKHLIYFLFLAFGIIFLSDCKLQSEGQDQDGGVIPKGTTFIQPSPQRIGDSEKGYEYLVYGNYVGSGIPYKVFSSVFGKHPNLLKRTGDSAKIPYSFNAVKASNGVPVVAANCLQCHAGNLNGELVVGLGATHADFTNNQSVLIPGVDFLINSMHGTDSKEYKAYEPFRRAVLATGSHLKTAAVGMNPADKLALVLAAHRNKDDLTWRAEPALDIPDEVVATDVPAWWLLKKKHAMFYNGMGQGDFAKIMMASGLLTLTDSLEAREIAGHFTDVLAYIHSIEAPVFPGEIDDSKVVDGKKIFMKRCSKCHGTYGDEESYPNLLVETKIVGTDPVLAQSHVAYSEYLDWYNTSWFSKPPNAAVLRPDNGYVAPPLDGIWATAPYLHNGSVPDLHTLLDSKKRPKYWSKKSYDSDKPGWEFIELESASGGNVFDTTLLGYGNSGHRFGDSLSDKDRNALIEYLKTL